MITKRYVTSTNIFINSFLSYIIFNNYKLLLKNLDKLILLVKSMLYIQNLQTTTKSHLD